jgi:hypothetical protein
VSDQPRVCIVLEVELATPTGPSIASTQGAFVRGIDAARALNVLAVSFDYNDLHCLAYSDGRGIALTWEDDQTVYYYEYGQIRFTEYGTKFIERREQEARLAREAEGMRNAYQPSTSDSTGNTAPPVPPRDGERYIFATVAIACGCWILGWLSGSLLGSLLNP